MEQYEREHYNLVRSIAPECMVLLKSDGSFPLDAPCPIALYGSGARHTIKGGTGSGDVNARHFTTVEEGLAETGFTITTGDWLDSYDRIYEDAHRRFAAEIKARIAAEGVKGIMLGISAVMPEPDYKLPLNGEGDTALYVLRRVSGEGADRTDTKGDFALSQTEEMDIRAISKQYPRFMLVLNVGGVVDISPILDDVPNILLLSQTGIAIGDALADVLLGRSYPSGKLSSTWAPLSDYCPIADFGNPDDTRYREGIYVGYRYFDTVGKTPLFAFGFGLGYTDFVLSFERACAEDSLIMVRCLISNVGKHPGKEVAQLYLSVPHGKLDQPLQQLAAFAKTRELQPDESEAITLSFDIRRMASFDKSASAFVLERGDYVLRLGTSSRTAQPVAVISLSETVITERVEHVGGEPDFDDWRPDKAATVQAPEELPLITLDAASITPVEREESKPSAQALALVNSLTDEELALLCVGGFENVGSGSVIGSADLSVAGAAGESVSLPSRGIAPLVMADGPAGLRLSRTYGRDEKGVYSLERGAIADMLELLPEQIVAMLHLDADPAKGRHGTVHEQNCTAIPVGVALAQSWNPTMVETCGDLVGDEMHRFGIHLWLAPALNIHRLPLCGRNFEYYSEDPLLSGLIAAAICRGVQRHSGCGTVIKHFVCNNQETNRMHNNSILSERTLREIYVKGFRIAIEEGRPACVMSSYNLLNGEHTSHRKDLMDIMLRMEWGFNGLVMSDWVAAGLSTQDKWLGACASGAIKAGNELMMPGMKMHLDNLIYALDNQAAPYPIERADLLRCAARVIDMVLRLTDTHGFVNSSKKQ